MTRFEWKSAGAAAVLAGALLAPATAARAGESAGGETATKLVLRLDRDGDVDRLKVEDIGRMAVGETRSFTTEAGKPVAVTRDDEGWEVEVDGRKVRVEAPPEPGAGDVHVARRMHVVDGAGKEKTMVFVTSESAAGDGQVRVIRRVGPGGEHAFAFHHGEGGAPLAERWIERLESNEKFRGLDAATRAVVLEALRESSPLPDWVDKGAGATDERVIVLDLEEDSGEEE